MKQEITNASEQQTESSTKELGRRAILVMSDCGSTPALATIISGYLASVGVRHGYISLDRTAEAVVDGFKRFGFDQHLELIDVWEPRDDVTSSRLQELVTVRKWEAVLIDNVNMLTKLRDVDYSDIRLILDKTARIAGVPIFCIANKTRKVEIE